MSKVLQNILYVEDEPDIQRIVKLALEVVAGMRIVACSSGAEAIARAQESAIDLILLDVMMPQMDGPTTLSRLRDIPTLKNTPVVFMTAKAHPTEVAHFKSLGALDVIAKPFDPMSLANTLREIWSRMNAVPVMASSIPESSTPAATNILINNAERSSEARFAERMAALTAQFRSELPSRLSTLQQQWRTLNETWSFDVLHELHRSTHNIAGAGATFGYDEVTVRARAVDRHFKALLEHPQLPDANLRQEISTLFAALESEMQRIVSQL